MEPESQFISPQGQRHPLFQRYHATVAGAQLYLSCDVEASRLVIPTAGPLTREPIQRTLVLHLGPSTKKKTVQDIKVAPLCGRLVFAKVTPHPRTPTAQTLGTR